MYDNETKDKFVELRAAGKSFGDISQELGVVKSTLHRWEDERADDIARLRRIQWEETEKSMGRRLEDQLEGLACDLLDYEQTLGNFNLGKLSVRETLMILRETRRAYFQTRALLMGTAPRPRPQKPAASVTPAVRSGLTCPDTLDSTNLQPANAVQNPASDQSEISNLRSEIVRSAPPANGLPTSADVSAPLASSRLCVEPVSETKSNETERFQQNGTTQHRNTNDLQQREAMSFDFSNGRATCPHAASPAENSNNPSSVPSLIISSENPASTDHSQLTDDNSPLDCFLGSIVVNPHECGAGIVAKWLEHEAAHRRASPAQD